MSRPDSRPDSRIVTVASGKGGVGKTWLALGLAAALAERGRRVLVVDADWGLANADVQLGLTGAPCLPIDGTADDLEEAAVPVPDAGFSLLAGASGSGRLADLEPARLERLAETLARLASRYDHLVIDLAAGADAVLRRWWRRADRPLLVLGPEPTSLTDAYALLKLCRQDGHEVPARIVVNRAPSRAAGEAAAKRLEVAARHFLGQEVTTAAVLLEDPRVPASIRAQRPFLPTHPNSATAAGLRALAGTI